MRLLKKSTLHTAVAQQKKTQIDEGVYIAGKIDALRLQLGSLQQQENQFFLGMQARLKVAEDDLNEQIRVKKSEIKALEEERVKLLIPLDAEWDKVNVKIKEVEGLKQKIEKDIEKLVAAKIKVEQKYKESKETLARIKLRERELIKVYNQAEEDQKEAQEIKAGVIKDKIEEDARVKAKNEELLSREAEIAVKERENEIERKQNEEERSEIISIKAQLEDQRKTLERALKRI